MAEQPTGEDQGGVSEALRTAIERTFASTAGSAAETRERAGELLDDVAKRGQDARGAVEDAGRAVAKRGQEAREASGAAATRVVEAIQGMRLATREDVAELREQIIDLQGRVAELEQRTGGN
ncbi:MAG: hypothetical protein EXQ70_10050 [Solirubrobacterales bacterium]|nr:hypothetical protein [Solirubrobacterales bacterium]